MPNKLIISLITFLISTVSLASFAIESNNSTIKIGMTVPLTGEIHTIGEGERIGVQVYFDRINAKGGIGGKKLELIALDDEYDPLKAAKNVHQLLEQKVFAFMGNMGSAPAIVTLPIIDKNKILLFAPVTGNQVYRKTPPDHYVFNFRASLYDETAALVNGVLSIGIKPEEIAFFTQEDSFGQNVYQGALLALKNSGYPHPELLPYGTFMRGTLNVEDALARIMQYAKVPIKAFILGGNYSTNAKFIKLAKKQYPNALFLSASDRVNPADFAKEEDKNIVTVQLVPDVNAKLPGVAEFRDDMKKYGQGAKPDSSSLEGYLSAKILVKALQKAAAENALNTEKVIDILEHMNNEDIGIDLKITFDKNHHQALQKVWSFLLIDGKFAPLDWATLQNKKIKK